MKYIFYLCLCLTTISCAKKAAKKVALTAESKADSKKNVHYKKAIKLWDASKLDSALIYFTKAKELDLLNNDSAAAGNSLVCMAMVSSDGGDHFGSQEMALEALQYFHEADTSQADGLYSNYLSLGNSSDKLKNYDAAISFFKRSLKFTSNPNNIIIAQNNLANAYRYNRQFDQSIALFEKLLARAVNETEQARIRSNLAYTKWLKDPAYNAAPELRAALLMRSQNKDKWGKNASFAHLSDYYKAKNNDSALLFATKMYGVAKELKSPDDQAEALEKLIALSRPGDSRQFFTAFRHLQDSLQNSRNIAKNQFALIRYETERHKIDNLKLQYQINQQKTYVGTAVILIVAGASFSIFYYRRRKQRTKTEIERSIKESELKTSKKIHDVVANGIYGVMSELENSDQLDREKLLSKLDQMYHKSRDISYEPAHFTGENFHLTIASLLTSFASNKTKVMLVGNYRRTWEKVETLVKYEIEKILQEFMVNMKKHSQASSVMVNFKLDGDKVVINYRDNGIGILSDTIFKNGLLSTGNRIKDLSGTINFDSMSGRGVQIVVTLPLA